MTNAKPTTIAYGTRDAMLAEVAAFDPRRIDINARECRYLVMPIGDAQWDTEWFPSLKQARKHAKSLAESYGAKVTSIA